MTDNRKTEIPANIRFRDDRFITVLKVPDDLTPHGLDRALHLALQIPEDRPISVWRFSQNARKYKRLKGADEFAALNRGLKVKSQLDLFVREKEAKKAKGAKAKDVKSESGATKPPLLDVSVPNFDPFATPVPVPPASKVAAPGELLKSHEGDAEKVASNIAQDETSSEQVDKLVREIIKRLQVDDEFRSVVSSLAETVRPNGPSSTSAAEIVVPAGHFSPNAASNAAGYFPYIPAASFRVACDGCAKTPLTEFHRCLFCTGGNGFDLCHDCYNDTSIKGKHQHAFTFVDLDSSTAEIRDSKEPADSAPELKASDPTVWNHVYCDGCRKSPVVGDRYKCLACADYDLCSDCIVKKSNIHNPTHDFAHLHSDTDLVKGLRPTPGLQTFMGGFGSGCPALRGGLTVGCDGCNRRILSDCYKCLNCEDFDYCADCYQSKSSQHAKDHTFLGPAPVMTCDGCEQRIISQSYHCENCYDFDFCSSCYPAKKSHPLEHVFVEQNQFTSVVGVFEQQSQEQASSSSVKTVPVAAQGSDLTPTHHPAICDGCEKSIVGLRFKCLDCKDFDYCSECVEGSEETHSGHSFVTVRGKHDIRYSAQSRNYNVHPGIVCDGPFCKGLNKVVTGDLYSCVTCDDLDFCSRCESSHSEHALLKIRSAHQRTAVKLLRRKPGQANSNPHQQQAESSKQLSTETEKPVDYVAVKKDVVKKVTVEEPVVESESEEVADLSATLVSFSRHSSGCLTWVYKNSGTQVWPRYTQLVPVVENTQDELSGLRNSYVPFATLPGATAIFTAFTSPDKLQHVQKKWVLKTPYGEEFSPMDFTEHLQSAKSEQEPDADANVSLESSETIVVTTPPTFEAQLKFVGKEDTKVTWEVQNSGQTEWPKGVVFRLNGFTEAQVTDYEQTGVGRSATFVITVPSAELTLEQLTDFSLTTLEGANIECARTEFDSDLHLLPPGLAGGSRSAKDEGSSNSTASVSTNSLVAEPKLHFSDSFTSDVASGSELSQIWSQGDGTPGAKRQVNEAASAVAAPSSSEPDHDHTDGDRAVVTEDALSDSSEEVLLSDGEATEVDMSELSEDNFELVDYLSD